MSSWVPLGESMEKLRPVSQGVETVSSLGNMASSHLLGIR